MPAWFKRKWYHRSPIPSPGPPFSQILAGRSGWFIPRLLLFDPCCSSSLCCRSDLSFLHLIACCLLPCPLPVALRRSIQYINAFILTNGPSMQHRTTQPYQNVAPVHHIQPSQPQAQSRTLSSSQPQQQPYPSPNVYTPQSGLQSPFLNQPPQFQQQQGPNDPPNFYTSNPSPRSQHSGAGPYYSSGKSNFLYN